MSDRVPSSEVISKINEFLDHCKEQKWELASPLWNSSTYTQYINYLPDKRFYLAIHQAAFHLSSEILEQILQVPNVNIVAQTRNSETALEIATLRASSSPTPEALKVVRCLRTAYERLTAELSALRNLTQFQKTQLDLLRMSLRATPDTTLFLGLYSRVDFQENLNFISDCLNIARENNSLNINNTTFKTSDIIPERADPEVEEWLKLLRPVHRCGLDIFKSILKSSTLLSKERIDQLKDLKSNISNEQERTDKLYQMIKERDKITSFIVGGLGDPFAKEIRTFVLDYINFLLKDSDKDKLKEEDAFLERLDNLDRKIREHHRKRHISLPNLREEAQIIVDNINLFASIGEKSKLAGKHCTKDKDLGNDKHIFAILGPNSAKSYYGEIALVLRREIMYHPDFNLTPTSALLFSKFSSIDHTNYKRRPWSAVKHYTPTSSPNSVSLSCLRSNAYIDPTVSVEEVLKRSKINPAFCHNWTEPLARDIQAQAHFALRGGRKIMENGIACDPPKPTTYPKPTEKIPASETINFYCRSESHSLIECHLPSNTSINYIEKIFVPKSNYANVIKAIEDAKLTLLSDGRELASLVESVEEISSLEPVFQAQIGYMVPTKDDFIYPQITVNVQGLEGAPAFLPFKPQNEGFLFGFQNKCTNDTRVCFATKESADSIMQVYPNKPKPEFFKGCLNFLIGCTMNTETYIRFGNIRTQPPPEMKETAKIPVVKVDEKNSKPLRLKYWFVYHKEHNLVAWGRGEPPSRLCSCPGFDESTAIQKVRYKIQLPHFQAVGVSSWAQPRTYQGMFIKDCPPICLQCLPTTTA